MSISSNIRLASDLLGTAASSCASLCLNGLPTFHLGRVHEANGPLRHALALSVMASSDGMMAWIGESKTGVWRAGGLAAAREPDHLICIQTGSRNETLWAAEQALRCAGIAVTVFQVARGPDLFESRRLQIAAQAGGGLGLCLIEKQVQSSAAPTRWHCSGTDQLDADWTFLLTKDRRHRAQAWSVRGDPDPCLTHPPDLLPYDLVPSDAPFRLTTSPCDTLPAAAARSLAPA